MLVEFPFGYTVKPNDTTTLGNNTQEEMNDHHIILNFSFCSVTDKIAKLVLAGVAKGQQVWAQLTLS